MFLNFYGLREQPFGVTPNTRYVYTSPGYREALASLVVSIEENLGFSALIGDPGMGKTTLMFSLMARYNDVAHTAFVLRTDLRPREMLREILIDLGLESHNDNIADQHVFHKFVIDAARQRRRVLLVIDEAQNLSDGTLESLRLMSNFETPEAKLVHITLSGQPMLAQKLQSRTLQQLFQRIPVFARLEALTPGEVVSYIEHRLRIAGYFGPPLFTPEAYEAVIQQSEGVPRRINATCYNALSMGCALRKQVIDTEIMREVAADRDLSTPRRQFPAFPTSRLDALGISDTPIGIAPIQPAADTDIDAGNARCAQADTIPIETTVPDVTSESASPSVSRAVSPAGANSVVTPHWTTPTRTGSTAVVRKTPAPAMHPGAAEFHVNAAENAPPLRVSNTEAQPKHPASQGDAPVLCSQRNQIDRVIDSAATPAAVHAEMKISVSNRGVSAPAVAPVLYNQAQRAERPAAVTTSQSSATAVADLPETAVDPFAPTPRTKPAEILVFPTAAAEREDLVKPATGAKLGDNELAEEQDSRADVLTVEMIKHRARIANRDRSRVDFDLAMRFGLLLPIVTWVIVYIIYRLGITFSSFSFSWK